ncbi:transposase [Streptococcus pneumoniae]|nr:transposase [Streptococcus pneumoniae]
MLEIDLIILIDLSYSYFILLILISFHYSSMNYEASKQLTDARFKRLVGVQRTTFEEMLAVLKTAYQLKHAKGGRKPKLSLEDLLMATLQYV